MTTTETLYVPPDVQAAYDAKSYNCGPAALAAILGRPVLSLASAIEPFKGYMAFRDMTRALTTLGVEHFVHTKDFVPKATNPAHGYASTPWTGRLSIVQWNGSWMQPGVHPGAALRRTHWVALSHTDPVQIYDVNGGADGLGGWMSYEAWKRLAARIMATVRGCDGTFGARSVILVKRPRG